MRGIVVKRGEKVARNGQPFTWFVLASSRDDSGVFLIAYAPSPRARAVPVATGRNLIRQGAALTVSYRPPARHDLPGLVDRVTTWSAGEPWPPEALRDRDDDSSKAPSAPF